jgi:hypothetical protein
VGHAIQASRLESRLQPRLAVHLAAKPRCVHPWLRFLAALYNPHFSRLLFERASGCSGGAGTSDCGSGGCGSVPDVPDLPAVPALVPTLWSFYISCCAKRGADDRSLSSACDSNDRMIRQKGPPKMPVRLATRPGFEPAHDRRQRALRLKNHVDVVGHDNRGVQRVEAACCFHHTVGRPERSPLCAVPAARMTRGRNGRGARHRGKDVRPVFVAVRISDCSEASNSEAPCHEQCGMAGDPIRQSPAVIKHSWTGRPQTIRLCYGQVGLPHAVGFPAGWPGLHVQAAHYNKWK